MTEKASKDGDKTKILEHVQVKLEDQDFMQRLYMVLIVPLELYRVMVSSLLIVFVPQACHGELCTMTQNLETSLVTYKAGLVVNFFTLIVFLTMYFFEVMREHMLIEYLEVNPESKNRDSEVGRNLVLLAEHKKEKILFVIKIYKYVGAFAIIMYIVNAIISAIIISHYYLGNQTFIAFVTNVLFMVLKFADVYWTIMAEPNVFISAYLKTKVQYNDVDPEHRRHSIELSRNA